MTNEGLRLSILNPYWRNSFGIQFLAIFPNTVTDSLEIILLSRL
jgi:hypothetical protein